MIAIDGSQGEGGGQVLRSSLTLSIMTGKAFRITNIRARRSNPGLRHQHLKAVDAAAAISSAQKEGASIGSSELVFRPGEIRSGRYTFNIGTAGSTALVLQTIFLPLSKTSSASSIIIIGGTHVLWSPNFHYLDFQWLPYMQRIGFDATLSLEKAGFYPHGGGRLDAVIRPTAEIHPLKLTERGNLVSIRGISAVSNLDMDIAQRQKRQTLQRVINELPRRLSSSKQVSPKIKKIDMPSSGKGTILLLHAEFEKGSCCYFGLGEIGKPAERVADEAVDALLEFIETDAVIDQYLADQLLLPLAFATGESSFRTSRITNHLLTNAEVIRSFLPAQIFIEGELGEPGRIRIIPPPSQKTVQQ